MTDRHTPTDALDGLGRFSSFRHAAPAATNDARALAHRAIAVEIERESAVVPAARRPRRPLVAAAGLAVAIAVVVVVGIAAWPSSGPRTLDVLAQARAALAPQGRIVQYRAVVSSTGGTIAPGVMERTEGWVLGRPDQRTEGRELTRYELPRSGPPHYTETSWRPDAGTPGRTTVLQRSATARAPTGPARRYVVGSARPTGSVFAHRLDPRDDGSWTLVRQTRTESVLEQRISGMRRTMVLDRRTHLPRRFVADAPEANGRRFVVTTEITAESVPVDATTQAQLAIDAPVIATAPSWGTRDASRRIDRARRLLTPADGLTTMTFTSDRTTERFDTRTGRRTMRYREPRRSTGAFDFRDGLLRRGRLTPINPRGSYGPQTTWTAYSRDEDLVLVRTGARRAVPLQRPSTLPVTIDALSARSDGWRVVCRTSRTVVLRTTPRAHLSNAELVVDRRTGAFLRGRTWSTSRDPDKHLRYALDLVQTLTTSHRPLRPEDAALFARPSSRRSSAAQRVPPAGHPVPR